jgi:hypothetical protein
VISSMAEIAEMAKIRVEAMSTVRDAMSALCVLTRNLAAHAGGLAWSCSSLTDIAARH